MKYIVMVDTGEQWRPGKTTYAVLDVNGKSTWKTKRIAEKHAYQYKAENMRDAWVEESV